MNAISGIDRDILGYTLQDIFAIHFHDFAISAKNLDVTFIGKVRKISRGADSLHRRDQAGMILLAGILYFTCDEKEAYLRTNVDGEPPQDLWDVEVMDRLLEVSFLFSFRADDLVEREADRSILADRLLPTGRNPGVVSKINEDLVARPVFAPGPLNLVTSLELARPGGFAT